MKIAKEGFPYIIVLFVLAALFLVLRFYWFGGILLGLAIFVTAFFRDPERVYRGAANHVLSPADGRVVSVRQEDGKDVVSIFLSIFNVHINRAPLAGRLTEIKYVPGKFLIAFDERASMENERNSITIDHQGKSVRFVQIAGLVARRIVCWKHEGEVVEAGERIGLIKFGSRVDVYFPAEAKVKVKVGERVKAGESVIGEVQ